MVHRSLREVPNGQVPPKSKSEAGLGRTLINDRVKSAQKARQNAKSGKLPKVIPR
jgi:hypothetical protein